MKTGKCKDSSEISDVFKLLNAECVVVSSTTFHMKKKGRERVACKTVLLPHVTHSSTDVFRLPDYQRLIILRITEAEITPCVCVLSIN